jgi:O-antigen/teichoic acid export membrane protein
MTPESNKRQIAQGVAWASSAQWGGQILSFGIYTGLARLLTPEVFGLVAIAGVYVAFMQIFVQQGFGTAVIQRRELEGEHLDSAFWIATATALFFCLLSVVVGRQIARLFHEPKVAPVIQWLSLSFLFYALSAIPTALFIRELDFRPLAVRSLIAIGAGGAVGLSMAYLGFGVWSIVGQQIVNSIVGCICLWWAVPWRPGLRFSKRHLHDLYGYSLSIVGNDVLWFFSQKSDQTLVGYGFGSLGLGPYSLASRVVTLIHDGIIGPAQSVAFPAFSKLQSDAAKLEHALRRFCEMSSLVSLPVFAGLIVVAPELVPVLFGPKWISAVRILQVLAVYGSLRVFLGFVHPLMLGKGRPGLYLLLNIILASITVAGCVVASHWSPEAIGISVVVTMLSFAALTTSVITRLAWIKIGPFLKSFALPLFSSLFMMAVVAVLRTFARKAFAPTITLAVCVVTGVVVYISTALYIKPALVKEIWEMASQTVFRPRSFSRDLSLSEREYSEADAEVESAES